MRINAALRPRPGLHSDSSTSGECTRIGEPLFIAFWGRSAIASLLCILCENLCGLCVQLSAAVLRTPNLNAKGAEVLAKDAKTKL